MNERLVSKETVVLHRWGSLTLKFGIKKFAEYRGQIITKLRFPALALRRHFPIRLRR